MYIFHFEYVNEVWISQILCVKNSNLNERDLVTSVKTSDFSIVFRTRNEEKIVKVIYIYQHLFTKYSVTKAIAVNFNDRWLKICVDKTNDCFSMNPIPSRLKYFLSHC